MKNVNKITSVSAIIIGALAVIADSWHILVEWAQHAQGNTFSAIAHYYQDFFLYSSFIAQGMRGSWVSGYPLFTNEPLPSTWYYWFYVCIGRIGSVTNLTAPVLYTLALFVCIALIIILTWKLIIRIFPSRFITVVAYLFLLTASNFSSGTRNLLGITWFSPTPALHRLGGVPHQAAQTVLIFFLILLATPYFSQKKIPQNRIVFTVLLSFVSALINPMHTLLLAASAIAVGMLKKQTRITCRFIGILLAPALLGAFLVTKELSGQQLFALARNWEMAQYMSTSPVDWLLSLGPILILIPFGIIPFFRKKQPLHMLISMYGALSVVAYFSPIPDLVSVARIRWLHPSSYILFPLLAASGFQWIISHVRISKPDIRAYAILIMYLGFTMPAVFIQITDRMQSFSSGSITQELNHVPTSIIQAFDFMSIHTKTESVILTDPQLPYDTAIPAFTARRSFTGHLLHTLYPEEKQLLRASFFSHTMNESDAESFLKNHRITTILVSKESKIVEWYPFLTKQYGNDLVSVYETSF